VEAALILAQKRRGG